jgi:hypothetical protein
MKRLFSTPDSAEMGLLKSRLEEAGIPCLLRNEQISQAIPSAAFSAELWIANDQDYQRAVALCETWRHPSSKTRRAWTCPKCGEKLEGQFSVCWKCGIKRDEAP